MDSRFRSIKLTDIGIYSVVFLLIFSATFGSCERDDICAEDTPKTPLLKVTFVTRAGNEETVPKFQIRFANSNPVGLLFPAIPTDLDSILIPLDTQSNETELYLIRNSQQVNKDTISIQEVDTINLIYNRRDSYISRACGYRVLFNALSSPQERAGDSLNWIERINIINTTVDSSEDTHITITTKPLM